MSYKTIFRKINRQLRKSIINNELCFSICNQCYLAGFYTVSMKSLSILESKRDCLKNLAL